MIDDCTTPKSIWDMPVFHEFTIIYQWLSRYCGKVTLSLSDPLMIVESSRKSEQTESEWTRDATLVFGNFKRAFINTPILNQFKPAEWIALQVDASSFVIASILNQYDCFCILRPVNFYIQQC